MRFLTLVLLLSVILLPGLMGCAEDTLLENGENIINQPVTPGISPNIPSDKTEMKEIVVSIRLSEPPPALTVGSIKALSIFNQIARVFVEVMIDGVLFSTTDLSRDTSDPLLYTGRISIPLTATADLHAKALDAGGVLLFEGQLRGLVARDFGEPAIKIILQRKIPVDPVPPPNTPPVIHGTIVADASLAYGQPTTMSVDAQDPQGDSLNYLWEVITAPNGVDTSGLVTQANQQGAIFTAPSTTGIFTIRATVSDAAGASVNTQVVIYVSETGQDGTPDTGIVLSDFPDCVNWNVGGRTSSGQPVCTSPSQTGNVQFTQTVPDRLVINPTFRYVTGNTISRDYTATQLFNMGFRFDWSDTCGGSNFISLDASQNETLIDLSSLFVPTFVKSGLASEACQLNLQITNPTGFTQHYQTVINFSDQDNNRNDPLDCATDPATTRPKVRLTCPTVMTSVPQVIQVDICDAQGDLSLLRYIRGGQWLWRRNASGNIIYTYDDTIWSSWFYHSATPSAGRSYNVLFIPYNLQVSSTQLNAVGADGYIDSLAATRRPDIIASVAVRLEARVDDRSGNSTSAYCTFAVDPNINLDIPAGYFP